MQPVLIAALAVALVGGAAGEGKGVIRTSYGERHCYHHEKCRLKPLANFRKEVMMAQKQKLFEECTKEHTCPVPKASSSSAQCVGGVARVGTDSYACNGVDLLSYVNTADLGSAVRGNDIWGWTDPEFGNEVAIVCLADGTSFVDVTDARNPVVLGYLRGTRWPASAAWRDVKVYKDHAFIGSEVADHGLQVFDLTGLRKLYGRRGAVVPLLENTAFYDEFGSSHNIVINEETGFLYAVGSRTFRGGPHIVDIRTPARPRFVAGWDVDGYTHDAQCVVYAGPDRRYVGHEICFCYNEDTLTILDVSDKDAIEMVSRVEYHNNYYTHQGWLNKEQSHLLMNDELDEQYTSHKNTRTLLWDVSDLSHPRHIGSHVSPALSIDHNLYLTADNIAYLSNYCSGLRVLDARHIASGETPELAFFDVAPYCDTTSDRGVVFQGTWSNYPYFKSKNIIVSSIELGLFVLRLQDSALHRLNATANATRA